MIFGGLRPAGRRRCHAPGRAGGASDVRAGGAWGSRTAVFCLLLLFLLFPESDPAFLPHEQVPNAQGPMSIRKSRGRPVRGSGAPLEGVRGRISAGGFLLRATRFAGSSRPRSRSSEISEGGGGLIELSPRARFARRRRECQEQLKSILLAKVCAVAPRKLPEPPISQLRFKRGQFGAEAEDPEGRAGWGPKRGCLASLPPVSRCSEPRTVGRWAS